MTTQEIRREEAVLRRQAREAKRAKIMALRSEGLRLFEIADQLGLSRGVVRSVVEREEGRR
jgi:DNA-binding CsgD family transcriptional regulator